MLSPQKIKTPFPSLLTALVFSALIGIAGCNKGETSAKYLQEAQTLYKSGQSKAAIIQLKNALQKNAENGDARYLLGKIYNETGDLSAAEKELRKARQLGIDPNNVQLLLAEILLKQGEFKQLLDDTSTSERKGEAGAKILTLRANAHLALGKQDEAKAELEEAIKQQPDNAEAYLGKARLAVAAKDIVEAMKQIDIALEKSPKNIEGWLMKGDLLRMQSNLTGAMAAYQQVVKIEANNVTAHIALASMYLAANKLEEASKEIQVSRKVEPKNLLAKYMAALLEFRQAKYSEARDELQQVLKIAPNHMPSVLLSGAISFALGTYEQAESDLGKFLNQFPNNIYARKLLAATLLKTKQAERALNTLKPALTGEIKDPQLLALAGEVYMAMNDYGNATEYFEKSVAIDPKNTALRTELGVSRLAKGDTAHAVAELESAAGNDPNQHSADIMLALTYLGKKDFDGSLKAIAALEKKQPDNPITFNLKGAAYLGKNDTVNARKSFEHALALKSNYVPAAMNLAQLDIKDKKPELARKRFEAILAKDKDNQQIMLALAVLAAGSGQEKEYVNWLEKAIKANPEVLKPRVLLANYYLQKREPQKALMQAREAQTSNPKNPEALDLLGSMQFAAGEKDNALATYKGLVGQLPKSPLALYKLGSVQFGMNDSASAEASYIKALDMKSDYIEPKVALIALYVKGAKYSDAMKYAQQVQKQLPKAALGFSLEGGVFMAQKEYGQAASVYDKAFKLEKTSELVINAHRSKVLAGNVKSAESQIQQWLVEHPDDLPTRAYLAENYMQHSQNKSAIPQYQFILQKEPNNLLALNNLAWLYQQEKDPRAVEMAEKAYKLQPENIAITDTLGWILVGQGQADRGIKLLQHALSKKPDAGEIHWHLAYGYFQAGNREQAKKELKRLFDSHLSFSEEGKARELLKQLGG
ncbi:XrtA/PEP-CTERM system TPR-repeat protein PrsT [Sulfurirhabdus autotrophica]|uniref:Putative PEP-CTERM system TPR-repeat lipoprotein n=1 Tax=Sulfurirhabdus autotrophica TaxID=1706046 RepID=A0A4R3XVZ4_9PROT|nr:XrtA/PEP-CTERM system TPR-repeat protein PrsT [Sulfurirhabdus autotrophica]TCV82398.1 putative PEP-CTERM system TPR-repeat lipoprotein [Sulfurirhabdus autotrophica]